MNIKAWTPEHDLVDITVRNIDRIPKIIINGETITDFHKIPLEDREIFRSKVNSFDDGWNMFDRETFTEYQETDIGVYHVRFEREAHLYDAHRVMIDSFIDYQELEESAILHRTDFCDDLSAEILAEWFDEYGDQYWNGECYRVNSRFDLYPDQIYDEVEDTWKTIRWELR